MRKASEENISAEGKKKKKRARLPEEDEHEGRPQGPEAKESQGKSPADRVAGSLAAGMAARRPVRLTAKTEMLSVRRAGTLHRGKYVFVWVQDGGEEDPPAIGVVTGRGFPGAVRRNLARRRLRGAVLEKRDLLERGKRYLFEARPGAEKADYQKLVFEIESALSRFRNCQKKRSDSRGK
jgi:ribonuclease P protein component